MHGCPVDHAFSVNIKMSDTVEILRNEIKNKHYSLENVDVKDIVLWKVHIPVNSLDTYDPNASITTLQGRRMHVVEKICNIFSTNEATEDCLHIIVQSPFFVTVNSPNCNIKPFIWAPTGEIALQALWNEISCRKPAFRSCNLGDVTMKARDPATGGLYTILKEDADLIKSVGTCCEPVDLELLIKRNDEKDKKKGRRG